MDAPAEVWARSPHDLATWSRKHRRNGRFRSFLLQVPTADAKSSRPAIRRSCRQITVGGRLIERSNRDRRQTSPRLSLDGATGASAAPGGGIRARRTARRTQRSAGRCVTPPRLKSGNARALNDPQRGCGCERVHWPTTALHPMDAPAEVRARSPQDLAPGVGNTGGTADFEASFCRCPQPMQKAAGRRPAPRKGA
jgi:hypothetical protein